MRHLTGVRRGFIGTAGRQAQAAVLVVILVAGLGVVVALAPSTSATPRAAAAVQVLEHGHARNDEQRPDGNWLFGALGYGFNSVEVDVWFRAGKLLVSHDEPPAGYTKTLDQYYLSKLRDRVAANGGRVYAGHQTPFTLVVDIKSHDSDSAVKQVEKDLKDRYAGMVQRWDNARLVPGPVRVVLTGGARPDLLKDQPVRYVFFDTGDPERHPASLKPVVNLDWNVLFGWDEANPPGSIGDADVAKLTAAASDAHHAGRQIRLYATPMTSESYWVSIEAGIDFIEADQDQMARLAAILRQNLGKTRLMVVGDSISQGLEGDFTWRYRLRQHFQATGTQPIFVGPWTGTTRVPASLPKGWPNTPTPPVRNGGYRPGLGRWNSQHYAQWGRAMHEAKDNIGATVAVHDPDYLLVELGFNDLGWGINNPAGLLSDVRTFVANARAAQPNVKVLLANVVHRSPLGNNSNLPATITDYNTRLRNAVGSMSTGLSPVALVDLDGQYDYRTDSYDDLHPNPTGEYKIARAFADVLSSRFNLGPRFSWPTSIEADLRPGTPTRVTATATDDGIIVSWTHVFGGGGYWLYQRDTAGGNFQRSAMPIPADSWKVGWLARGHTYEFFVSAARGGYEGAYSATVTVTATANLKTDHQRTRGSAGVDPGRRSSELLDLRQPERRRLRPTAVPPQRRARHA